MSNLPVQQSRNLLLKPNVAEIVKNEVFDVVKASIAQCYAHLNFSVPGEADRNYLVNEVTDSIINNYPSIRIQEIPLAFSNGIRKKYGEYFGLCVVSFEQFIAGYLNSPERAELVKEKSKLIEEKTAPTEEEQAQMAWKNLLNAWATFKKEGSYNDFGNAVYKTLVDNGKINFSDEQKADFYRLAKAELMKQYNPVLHVGNVVKMNECKSIIAEITSGGDQNTRVKVNAKKIALNQFFKELAEMEMDITDLFAE